MIALLALWPAFSAINERANQNPAPVQLAEPGIKLAQAGGFPDWQVRFMEPDARLARTWQAPGADRPVRLE
ncbi:exosortase A, partial [Acinetobacter baumannii]|nr:exosortase A [Acinetobacter baumannii]